MFTINDVRVPVTVFPDGTSQIWKLPEEITQQSLVSIFWKFESEAEVFQLVQLKTLLDSLSIDSDLVITYLPYGRQDKPVSNTQTFALTPFATILNSLKFPAITIMDPHSPMATNLIHNSVAIYPVRSVVEIAELNSIDLICYPDAGARGKYRSIYEGIAPYIYGDKIRDQLTGNITGYTVHGIAEGKRVLIVDDICDGGATFKLLAKDLLGAGARSVVLFVTHGIFSKGLQTLRDSGITRIYDQNGEKL
jgi:ribose-phosphate pyrophosphokinase